MLVLYQYFSIRYCYIRNFYTLVLYQYISICLYVSVIPVLFYMLVLYQYF